MLVCVCERETFRTFPLSNSPEPLLGFIISDLKNITLKSIIFKFQKVNPNSNEKDGLMQPSKTSKLKIFIKVLHTKHPCRLI